MFTKSQGNKMLNSEYFALLLLVTLYQLREPGSLKCILYDLEFSMRRFFTTDASDKNTVLFEVDFWQNGSKVFPID